MEPLIISASSLFGRLDVAYAGHSVYNRRLRIFPAFANDFDLYESISIIGLVIHIVVVIIVIQCK